MGLYIAFEGPIAAGKTTWATKLATPLASELLLEVFEDNDYLADYYSDRATWALPMQLWFLAERHRQLSLTRFDHSVVADYAFLKEDVFSLMLFTGRDLRLYSKIREQLGTTVQVPSLYVYVDASTDVLLRRIRERGRPYESFIDSDYLNRLRSIYDEVLEVCDVVRINTSNLDLASQHDAQDVLERILAALKKEI